MPEEKLTEILEHVNSIKSRLVKCETAAEVAAVADDERSNVLALAEDAETKVFAIQIANLKAYRLWQIANPL